MACLTNSEARPESDAVRRANDIMGRFYVAIWEHPDRSPGLADLCRSLGVADRMFHAWCRTFLGVAPQRYMCLRRLLWAGSANAPAQLGQAMTDANGHFAILVNQTASNDTTMYLVATGGKPAVGNASADNPALALLTVLGSNPPSKVTINEMTTVASVWTNAQFIDGTAIKGYALGLRIAAGNVPNFVDLTTGGWGAAIPDPLNSGQTPTMGNFAMLAGCATRIVDDACSKLFAAAMPPAGSAPTETLMAAESIARYPWYQPERLFTLLDHLYPVPNGKKMRAVPFMPYLGFAPSAWVLPLSFDGGGYRAGGKAMFDSEGNLWVGDNFTVG
jgi:hypothetical protein